MHHVIHLQKSKTKKITKNLFRHHLFLKKKKKERQNRNLFFHASRFSLKRRNTKKDFHMHRVFKNPKNLIRIRDYSLR